MKTNQHCWGCTMQGAMWGNDTMDDGFYSLKQNITRALVARDHLGYCPKTAPWRTTLSDFGYDSINSSITRT